MRILELYSICCYKVDCPSFVIWRWLEKAAVWYIDFLTHLYSERSSVFLRGIVEEKDIFYGGCIYFTYEGPSSILSCVMTYGTVFEMDLRLMFNVYTPSIFFGCVIFYSTILHFTIWIHRNTHTTPLEKKLL